MILLLALACNRSEPPAEPAPTPPPAAVPPAPEPAPTTTVGARILELDAPGGANGAPEGTAFIVPAGAAAEVAAGALAGGASGFRLAVKGPGDALVCTQPVDVGASLGVEARVRVSELVPGAQDWHGLNVEVRARDAGGALVAPATGRYVLVRNLRENADWYDLQGTAAIPPGASRAELCFRFVESTGVVEVDRIALTGVVGGETVAVAAGTRWELDGPGGGGGAPQGATFYIPPGTPGVRTHVGDIDGAKGFSLEVDAAANALACSDPFPITGKALGQGRVRVRAIQAGSGPYQGFTAEVRSYDPSGGLVPGTSSQYLPLKVFKATGDWSDFSAPFTPPPGAATGKVCVRFVESTGAVDVDWLGVAPVGVDAVVEGGN